MRNPLFAQLREFQQIHPPLSRMVRHSADEGLPEINPIALPQSNSTPAKRAQR